MVSLLPLVQHALRVLAPHPCLSLGSLDWALPPSPHHC